VTFLTMSYIVFVNPAILSSAGLPFNAVAVATALAAAGFTILMGLATNLPFALASGLGINAVVAFDIILGRHVSPDVGMACIVLEGAVAVVLVLAGLREAVVRAVPTSLKLAIGVGIGLFGVRGAILLGIATSTVLGLAFGVLDGPSAIARWPSSGDFSTIGDGLSPSALSDALTWTFVPVIFALFMTDFFDTVGTAYAVTSAGGLLDEHGEVPKIRPLLLVDSVAAAGGGAMGVSSVTTYVESGAGVSEGARTGLASLVTGALFALTIFFVPLIAVVGQGVAVGKDTIIHPAIAPALVMVGYLMIQLVQGIDWEDPESAVPAFLVIVGVPLTFSISAGIGLGVFGYVVTMLARRRAREVHPIMWALVPLFAAFFASDWLSSHVF
jgi:AGZA family xanthine/uracil permease-like MFS transporter